MLAGKDGPPLLKVIEEVCWCLDEATKAAFRAMAERKRLGKTKCSIEFVRDQNQSPQGTVEPLPTLID